MKRLPRGRVWIFETTHGRATHEHRRPLAGWLSRLFESVNMNNALEPAYDESVPPIWEVIEEIGKQVPEEDWDAVPSDLSKNLKHYLHGFPKEDGDES